MKSKLIHEHDGETDLRPDLRDGRRGRWRASSEFARQHGLGAARFTAIGAFQEATLGYFDWQTKEYRKIPVREQVEVLSLVGDVAQQDGEPKVHAHVVVGRSDGSTRAATCWRPTSGRPWRSCWSSLPRHLRKEHDPASGLALIRV